MLESRALVLDDDPHMVEMLARSLSPLVRQVDRATEPHRALALFTEHKHPVVVLDLVMPQMTGFEVMRRVLQLQARTQVIIVTGHPSIDSAVEAVNEHAFGYLRKPFGVPELRRMAGDAFAHYQSLPRSLPADEAALEAEIAALYADVANHLQTLEQSPNDPASQAAYRGSLDRLRSAQAREAEISSRVFRDHLALRKGAGYASIEAARRVLDRDKDSA